MSPRIGSLCTGYGGLDIGVHAAIGGSTSWVTDTDPGARKILDHRFPGTPNLGDITTLDWDLVEPVDVLVGGTPCQDLSSAGKRRGMSEGTRSNLWVAMREAIATLRPDLIIWENVGGAYSAGAASEVESDPRLLGIGTARPTLRALGRVVGDLSTLGYVGGWHGLRASDVGACHGRFRVFVAATHPDRRGLRSIRRERPERRHADRRDRANAARDHREPPTLLPTPDASAHKYRLGGDTQQSRSLEAISRRGELVANWGKYTTAVTRWEHLTRPAPPPVDTGPKGDPRLAPVFSEWMMGLPAGWVTDTPGITRTEALRALGNGVVPQQAEAAIRLLLDLVAAP